MSIRVIAPAPKRVIVTPSAVSGNLSLSIARGERGATGPRGLQGEQGPVGPTGPQGPAGADGTAAVIEHIGDETPHPVYDDAPSLTLLFENRIQ